MSKVTVIGLGLMGSALAKAFFEEAGCCDGVESKRGAKRTVQGAGCAGGADGRRGNRSE